jgi:hypothetical protein
MKRLMLGMTLTFAFSISALAGEIPSVGAPAPAGTTKVGNPDPGEVPTTGVADEMASDALSAVLAVLCLLS